MTNYYDEINKEAKMFIDDYEDEITELMKEKADKDYSLEGFQDDFNLYEKVHEWLDGAWYGFLRRDCFEPYKSELLSSASVLEESENVETDNGLWEGQEPTEAIQTMAFFTARNDLTEAIRERLSGLLSDLAEAIAKNDKK